ncbi:hypothetical protein E2C01_102199 [Portunus trituberculatus]|uniref:Uncharacterized protein n=1 Tax=Portunus trituberculatus TaxID=210409 RepID=A0A5B7KGQ5_PORTR|nr:hypothetical protein [Portunus trituberculatus]
MLNVGKLPAKKERYKSIDIVERVWPYREGP